jgi:hypothetical protein
MLLQWHTEEGLSLKDMDALNTLVLSQAFALGCLLDGVRQQGAAVNALRQQPLCFSSLHTTGKRDVCVTLVRRWQPPRSPVFATIRGPDGTLWAASLAPGTYSTVGSWGRAKPDRGWFDPHGRCRWAVWAFARQCSEASISSWSGISSLRPAGAAQPPVARVGEEAPLGPPFSTLLTFGGCCGAGHSWWWPFT